MIALLLLVASALGDAGADRLEAYRICDAAHRARPLLRRTATTWSACVQVAVAAQAAELGERTVLWVVATASHETDFRPRPGAEGERGALQVKRKYWCPPPIDDCDVVAAGVRAFAHYLRRARGDHLTASAAFNGGWRNPDFNYALGVERKQLGILRQLRGVR